MQAELTARGNPIMMIAQGESSPDNPFSLQSQSVSPVFIKPRIFHLMNDMKLSRIVFLGNPP